jgi:protocatechuate 3,4-dioxygenase beta subunit
MQIDLPAPVCDGSLTPAQTEGPYYKAGAPQRNSLLEPDMPGQRLIVVGYVLGRDCRPIPNAWLDFWQADAQGVYDNQGFILRGHQFTDAQGRYFLETVLPGKYPGRPQHIHLKIQPPGGAVFTSQLYFPQEPVPGLTAQVEERQEFLLATFNFVVE